MRQAIEYGANNGVPWVILTNAMLWRVYKIRFEKPISYDLVCSFNLSELDPKNEEHQRELFIICKEGLVKAAREEFHEKKATINRFILGALILSDEVVSLIRRSLRKLSDGVQVDSEEIAKVLMNEVLKRDVVEGEEATKAQKRVRRLYGKAPHRTKAAGEEKGDDTCISKQEEKTSFPDE
jgi:predicted type IV restriction endonuclease